MREIEKLSDLLPGNFTDGCVRRFWVVGGCGGYVVICSESTVTKELPFSLASAIADALNAAAEREEQEATTKATESTNAEPLYTRHDNDDSDWVSGPNGFSAICDSGKTARKICDALNFMENTKHRGTETTEREHDSIDWHRTFWVVDENRSKPMADLKKCLSAPNDDGRTDVIAMFLCEEDAKAYLALQPKHIQEAFHVQELVAGLPQFDDEPDWVAGCEKQNKVAPHLQKIERELHTELYRIAALCKGCGYDVADCRCKPRCDPATLPETVAELTLRLNNLSIDVGTLNHLNDEQDKRIKQLAATVKANIAEDMYAWTKKQEARIAATHVTHETSFLPNVEKLLQAERDAMTIEQNVSRGAGEKKFTYFKSMVTGGNYRFDGDHAEWFHCGKWKVAKGCSECFLHNQSYFSQLPGDPFAKPPIETDFHAAEEGT
jgi:hypothetical protein